MQKKIKISKDVIGNLNNQPVVAVIGPQLYKAKFLNEMLSNTALYSKKFGRIIYIGQKKYKSPSIVQDEKNWFTNPSYAEIIDILDDAKRDNIVNMLFVFNTKDIAPYMDTIDKLIGMRFTYLKGLIGMIVSLQTPTNLKKSLFNKFNNVFLFDAEHWNLLK